MLYVINGTSTNPYYNLAAEQVIFDRLDRTHSYLYLWQNDNTVVIGHYQNTYAQINREYVEENHVNVVRRLSGGGAVYHDLNNLNFTFITDADPENKINFRTFLNPIVELLCSMGVPAEINGRNDMTVEGKKFSGNAQYIKEGRVMHHGTLLFDCDAEKISHILQVSGAKISGKGVDSVKSRVCSLNEYLPPSYSIDEFRKDLIRHLAGKEDTPSEEYHFSEEEEELIRKWQKERYETWEWNFGQSPEFTMTRDAYIEGVGSIELNLLVNHGILEDMTIRGDYFSASGPQVLTDAVKGCPFRRESLEKALSGVDIPQAVHGMDLQTLLELMTG